MCAGVRRKGERPVDAIECLLHIEEEDSGRPAVGPLRPQEGADRKGREVAPLPRSPSILGVGRAPLVEGKD
eukprot:1777284-Alexandrium_andersonii.AAC.1